MMILDSVRARRTALARLWGKAGLPAVMAIALLATLGWRLLRWDWLTPVVAAAVFGAFTMIVVNDLFTDRVPRTLPPGGLAAWRWVLRNLPIVVYPAATGAGIVASSRLGWAWIIALTTVLGMAALLETVVLVLSRRWVIDPARCREARAFGSDAVSVWFDLSAILMLMVALIQHPHDHGAGVLHWLIPMFAVACIADARRALRRIPS
jgi:hypothetical protein